MIIDDHRLFAGAISAWFESLADDIKTICVESCSEAEEQILRNPDISIVLLDLNLEAEDGVTTYRHLNKLEGKRAFILCTGDAPDSLHLDERLFSEVSLIFKSDPLETFKECFLAVINGYRFHSDSASKVKRLKYIDLPELTLRQKAILALILAGESNQLIAERLNVTENTIKTHIRHLYSRLGVNSRIECIDRADQMRFYLD
ncbi:response regulator transcription factor [Marinobacterium sediminicola]|uniref:response regulator transcription factor n=1 Tax=Marinobacterium sediminicola TaxID=518898 RepID=UPI001EEFF676|nr:response regulator transcription factor [Marinobacterium sediminicola]ULG68527.1 response regulator transcription factor [Marinobacterium sediminicola]